jgi:hypothetical protein
MEPPPGPEFLCPSTSAENATLVIGVVQRREDEEWGRVAYARSQVAFTDALRALTEPVGAAEVLRLAGPCAEDRCAHHVDHRCTLGERAAEVLPTVVQRAPRCSIRSRCRWYAEQGVAACLRCPGIVTSTRHADDRMRVAAAPPEP